jgi:RNA polymerase sigma-70 factor, ECF subfamily
VPGPGPDAPPIADEELLEATRRGDLPAFERLYERHGARMKSIAGNLLGSASDAEDAVQESFLKIYRGAASFRGGSRLSTWIYRILLNTCYDLMRRRQRRPEGSTPSDASDARLDLPAVGPDHPLRLELEDSVSRLPERPRAVFLLAAVEGLSHAEIGEILGISEATSRTLLFEARRQLQRLLWTGGARQARA